MWCFHGSSLNWIWIRAAAQEGPYWLPAQTRLHELFCHFLQGFGNCREIFPTRFSVQPKFFHPEFDLQNIIFKFLVTTKNTIIFSIKEKGYCCHPKEAGFDIEKITVTRE